MNIIQVPEAARCPVLFKEPQEGIIPVAFAGVKIKDRIGKTGVLIPRHKPVGGHHDIIV